MQFAHQGLIIRPRRRRARNLQASAPRPVDDSVIRLTAALTRFACLAGCVVRTLISALALGGVPAVTALLRAQHAPAAALSPGAQADGSTLLPSGWRLTPAGRHLMVGDLPLNAVQSPDSRYLIVANNGLAKPSLSVIDVASWTIKSTTIVDGAWLGLAWHPSRHAALSERREPEHVQEFSYADGALTPARKLALPAASGETLRRRPGHRPDGRTLYVTRLFAQTVTAIDLASGSGRRDGAAARRAVYVPRVAPTASRLYVSVWGGAVVDVFDARTLDADRRVRDRRASERDGRFRPTAGGSSSPAAAARRCWVFDTFSGDPIEQISPSLFPAAPPTSTPNSLALSPDGSQLLVANADDNAVAVVDVTNAGRSFVDGFIPTGWYPTGALFSRDGKQIFVLNGKGLAPAPNPTNDGLDRRLQGAVSVLPTPGSHDARRLHAHACTRRRPTPTPRASRRSARPSARRFPRWSARARRSSTSSTSSARTAPTIRSSATCRRATATRS